MFNYLLLSFKTNVSSDYYLALLNCTLILLSLTTAGEELNSFLEFLGMRLLLIILGGKVMFSPSPTLRCKTSCLS